MAEETIQSTIVELLLKAVDEISGPVEESSKSLENLVGTFRSVASAASEIFVAFESLKGVIEPAAAMETAMTKLQIATDAGSDTMEEAKRQAEDLSVAYGVNAEKIVGAQGVLAAHLGTLQDALKNSESFVALSTSSQEDATTVARTLGEMYLTLGKQSLEPAARFSDMADLLDVLYNKFNANAESMSRMGFNLSMLGNQAKQLGLPMTQLETIFAEAGKMGIGGPRGPALMMMHLNREIFGNLAHGNAWTKLGLHIAGSPGNVNEIQTIINAMKNQPEQFQKFKQHLGASGPLLQMIVDYYTKLADVQGTVVNRQGDAIRDGKKMTDTVAVLFERWQAGVASVKTHIGEGLEPATKGVLRTLITITSAITKFADANPEVIRFAAIITGAVAAIMTLSAVLALIPVGLALITTAFAVATGPIGVAILGLTALGMFVAGHWTEIVGWYKWGVEQVRYAMDLYERFVRDPLGTIEVIQKSALRSTKTWLDATVDSLQWAGTHPKKALAGLSEWLLEGFAAQLASVQGGLSGFKWDSPQQKALNDQYVKGIKGAGGNLHQIMHETFGSLFDFSEMSKAFHVPDIMSGVGSLLTTISGAWQKFHSELDVVYDAIGRKVDWLGEKFKALLYHITPDFGLPSWLGGTSHKEAEPIYPVVPPLGGGPRVVPEVPPSYVPPWGRDGFPRFGNPGSAGPQQKLSMTYSPNVTIHVTSDGGSDNTTALMNGIDQAHRQHSDDIRRIMEDSRRDDTRTTFADPASSLA